MPEQEKALRRVRRRLEKGPLKTGTGEKIIVGRQGQKMPSRNSKKEKRTEKRAKMWRKAGGKGEDNGGTIWRRLGKRHQRRGGKTLRRYKGPTLFGRG